MPANAMILSVQTQRGQPCVLALVDPDAPRAPRRLHVYGTGHRVRPDCGRFVGTFQMAGGNLIFHLFDAAPHVPNEEFTGRATADSSPVSPSPSQPAHGTER